MFGIGPGEMFVFGIIALLLFGKRLPEVARSLGKGIVEFKKGMNGIEEEVSQAVNRPSAPQRRSVTEEMPVLSAPKFQPPTSEPVAANSPETHSEAHS